MKRFLLPLCLLLSGVFFQGGCTNAGTIVVVGLRVELTGIERSADGSATVTWRVQNPNVAPYLVARTNHKIYLNNTLVGSVDDREPMAVPAQSNASQTSKLVLAGAAADRLLADAAGHAPVSYKVDSKIEVVIYGDSSEKGGLTGTGTVAVTNK
jgi:LEA14-like dessication related protein